MTGTAPSLIEVSVGPRNAWTDPKTGLRMYQWENKDYPSVTSIRRMAGLPFRLHQWTISQVVNRAIEDFPTLTALMTRDRRPRERVLEKNRIKETKTWLRAASTEERDRAGDLGTRVHDHAVRRVPIVDADPDVAAKLHQFYDWQSTTGAEIIAVERQVWNLSLGYAGTFDLLCRMPDGTIRLVDLKTGKGTYTEHAMQCMAYTMAEFVGEDNVIDVELTGLLLTVNDMSLLHLGDESWHEQMIEPTMDLFKAFQGLLTFSVFAYKYQEIDDLVVDEVTGSA